jgi:hypothetical protein
MIIILFCLIISTIELGGNSFVLAQEASYESKQNANEWKFDLLHTASKDNYDAWTSNVWGTVSFLLIVIGWLLTTKGARIFLSKNTGARRVVIYAVALIALINMLLNLDLARRSADIQEELVANKYVSQYSLQASHYGRYSVTYRNAVISDILVGVIFGLIVYLLTSLAKWEEPRVEKE